MARNLNKVFIIDLEATCISNEEKLTNPNFINEIIEIGITVVDTKTKSIIQSEGVLIKPQFSEVTPFCTELTTLTSKDLETARTFTEAMNYIKSKYKPQDCLWVSWGSYDRNQLAKDSSRHNYTTKVFGQDHLNLKNLFSVMNKLPKEIGMSEALKYLNIPLDGTHHRGVDDSRNIAKIFINQILD